MSDPVRDVGELSAEKRRLYELLLSREEEAESRAEGPIPKLEPGEPVPLSLGQERLWFVQRMAPESCAYNVPTAVRLHGPLDRPALRRSLDAVVRRHAVLRTRFPEVGGTPAQVVEAPRRLPVPVVDLGFLPVERRERQVFALARELDRCPFDLAAGPLVRAALLDLGPADAALVLDFHHTVCDGTSIGLLVEEVATCYEAERRGTRPWLPPLPVQYTDFAAWQRRVLTGETLDDRLEYWRGVLAGPLPVLDLPTDRPRPPVQGSRGGRCYFRVAPVEALALRTLAAREQATLYAVLMAGFQALLQRYAGQDEFLVGMPVSGRPRAELERLVGFFVDTVVLRADLAGEPSFRQLVRRVSRSVVGAMAHQDVGFDNLVEAFQAERDLSHHPLFQVAMSLQPAPLEPMERAGLLLEPLDVDSGTARVDLEVVLWEMERGVTGYFGYDADLFDAATVARAARHLLRILAAGAAAPERAVGELPLLASAERQQLLVEWSGAGTPYPKQAVVPELFTAVAAERPDAVAVASGGTALGYGELSRRARRLGARLRRLGAGAEVPVGLLLERSPEMVVATLAVLEAGSYYVPLEPSYPPARVLAMLADAGAPVLVTRRELVEAYPELSAEGGVWTGEAVFLDDPDLEATESPEPEATESLAPAATAADPGGLCYVMYTSGSTGRPKGVAVPHRGVVRLVRETDYAHLDGDDTVLHLAPSAFDVSTMEVWGPLLNGARLEVHPAGPLDLEELGRTLRERRVTHFAVTASLFHRMVEERVDDFDGLAQLMVGGEVLSPGHVRQVLRRRSGTRLVNGYGPTENTTMTSWHPMAAPEDVATPVPVGRPVANTAVALLDAGLRPVPAGVPAELCAAGDGLARGYLGRPARTAGSFVPHPEPRVPGERLYRTGDLARWRADGTLEFLGRRDHQVKIRGFRVELGEVEAALAGLPGVARAAAALAGETVEERRLVGFAVPAEGAELDSETLRSSLRERLSEAMVPSAVVVLPELPLDPNGKVDRSALPAPEWRRDSAGPVYVEPRNRIERALATIWREVLGCERVGVDDDFFALGGQSLLATRVASRVREELGLEVPLRTFFERPTVRGLARAISVAPEGPGEPAPPVVPVPRDRPLPLSFAQERLWFIDRLVPGLSAYNVPGLVSLSGRLRRPLLRRVLEEIVRRHEVLRSRFPDREGRPVQVVEPPPRVPLPEIDLRRLGAAAEGRALALAAAEAPRPFRLEAGGLVRFTLFRLADDRWLLTVIIHHIVFDLWSRTVLIEELGSLYRAFAEDAPSPLPELAVQYGDFAVWQRDWLQGERLEALIGRWTRRLDGTSFTLALPSDRPRASSQSFRGARASRVLDADTSAGVDRLAERLGTTPFTVGLATFFALLARLSGQEDLVVGSPIANRTRVDLEDLIGFFANTLVLRGDLSGEPTFTELVDRVREGALDAFADQDLPFELLVGRLQPERDRSRQPLVQVVFNFIEGYLPPPLTVGGLTFTLDRRIHSGGAPFDLTLAMFEIEGRYNLALDYAQDLFDATTARRWTGHFENLLTAALREPERPVRALPVWSRAERHQVLVETNDTALPAPASSVLALFHAAVRKGPDAVALVAGREHVSYGELGARAAGRAEELRHLGVAPGARVATLLDPGIELVVTVLAIRVAGAAYVPLEASFPPERTRLLLDDAAPAVVITARAVRHRLPPVAVPVVEVETLDGVRGDPAAPVPASSAGPADLAYVMYTSGSTGRPKGVAVAERGIVRLVQEPRYARLGPDETLLQLAPVGFDASTFEIWGALARGGRLVILPAPDLGAEGLARSLAEERVTTLWLTAGLFHQVVDRDLGALRGLHQLLAGGDALSPAHVDRALAELPGCAVVNGYGPTEGTTFTCCRRYVGEREPRASVPVGRPVDGTGVYVLDPHLRPVPAGVGGELCAAGDGLAWGYLRRPARTAASFVPDPHGRPGGRLYRTGDLARLLPAGGDVEFLGRIDLQVKVRGFRVEPGEVEAALAAHPAVREAAVIVVAGTGGPAADRRLAAFVVPTAGGAPTVLELRAHLEERLPSAMIPSTYAVLEALPLTANGKVDRRALAAAEAPTLDSGTEHVAPRSELEEEIAALWGDLLGVSRVGVHDNFFHAGGHSLLATQLVSQVRARYRLDLPLTAFFEAPTVSALARTVEVTRWAAAGREEVVVGSEEDLEEGEL